MQPFTERQIGIMESATQRIDAHGIQTLTIKNLAADLGLSEPALYRHFENKNAILLGLLNYFSAEMVARLADVRSLSYGSSAEELRAVFDSQLRAFTAKPSVVSVIFAENIFHYDKRLSAKVADIMDVMQGHVTDNIKTGQAAGEYSKLLSPATLTTIVVGSMRLAVLKWKVSGNRANLVKDGRTVLDGVLKMLSTNN